MLGSIPESSTDWKLSRLKTHAKISLFMTSLQGLDEEGASYLLFVSEVCLYAGEKICIELEE